MSDIREMIKQNERQMAKLKMVNNSPEKMTMEEAEEKLKNAELRAEQRKQDFYDGLFNRAKKVEQLKSK